MSEGKRVGRKGKLTKELIKEAARLLEAGNYARTVAAHLGIGEATWYEWIARGEEKVLRRPSGDRKGGGIYAEFAAAVKQAEPKAEIEALQTVMDAGKENWQARAWFLERKFPDKFGRRTRIENVGDDGGPVKVEIEWADKES